MASTDFLRAPAHPSSGDIDPSGRSGPLGLHREGEQVGLPFRKGAPRTGGNPRGRARRRFLSPLPETSSAATSRAS